MPNLIFHAMRERMKHERVATEGMTLPKSSSEAYLTVSPQACMSIGAQFPPCLSMAGVDLSEDLR